jgi:hypothetical protein
MMGHKLSIGAVAKAAVLGVSTLPANANQVLTNGYSVSPTFPDFNLAPCGVQDCGQDFGNEVGATLSGGLPVVAAGNPAGLVEAVGSPLQWWTPQPGVTFEGSTVQTLPVAQSMFVPEGTGGSDADAFQTAIFAAILTVGPRGDAITFGGDDDMFLALNGTVVDQVGGIHPTGLSSTYDVGPGIYLMEAFYADRHVVDAYAGLQLTGDITTIRWVHRLANPFINNNFDWLAHVPHGAVRRAAVSGQEMGKQ